MDLPDPIDAKPGLTPVAPPPGSPDAARRTGGPAAAPVAPADAAPARPLPAERLKFAGRAREEVIALDWPFERDGALVETVTVRRLTVAEVAEVVDTGALAEHGLWAVWAAQAGLTVGELRGLDEDDGRRVTEAADRFLPRAFAAVSGGSSAANESAASSPSGAATSPA